jgi:hypothetical protein
MLLNEMRIKTLIVIITFSHPLSSLLIKFTMKSIIKSPVLKEIINFMEKLHIYIKEQKGDFFLWQARHL